MYLIKYHKSPYFQIVYYANGKKTKKSTGEIRRTEALKVLQKFKEDFNSQEVEYSILLSKLKEEYTNFSRQSKSSSYVESIKLSFNRLIASVGDLYLHNITTRIMDQFISSTYARSKSAAGLYYRTLKAAFNKALVWEYIDENPLKKSRLQNK
jgi:hypothetical protein